MLPTRWRLPGYRNWFINPIKYGYIPKRKHSYWSYKPTYLFFGGTTLYQLVALKIGTVTPPVLSQECTWQDACSPVVAGSCSWKLGVPWPGLSGRAAVVFFPFDPKNHSWVMVQFWMIFWGTVILGNFMKIPPGLQPFFGWDRTWRAKLSWGRDTWILLI